MEAEALFDGKQEEVQDSQLETGSNPPGPIGNFKRRRILAEQHSTASSVDSDVSHHPTPPKAGQTLRCRVCKQEQVDNGNPEMQCMGCGSTNYDAVLLK